MPQIALPIAYAEKLIDLAARAQVSDVPTLQLFAEVRLLIERAKRGE